MVAFLIWAVVGCFFVGMGINSFFRKKAVGFWANAEQYPVTDVKKYNSAVGKLFVGYGIVLILLGIPLLNGQNSAGILLSVLGVMFETIAMMVIYTLVITKKYRQS